MTLSIKSKITIAVVSLLTAFATGRYSVQAPAVKTQETVKSNENIKTDKDIHKVTVITKKPTGEEVTTITEDDKAKSDSTSNSTSTLDQTVTPPKINTLNVSALAGIGLASSIQPTYGLSISKQLIGPVTTGLFGLTNGTIGVSIGLNF